MKKSQIIGISLIIFLIIIVIFSFSKFIKAPTKKIQYEGKEINVNSDKITTDEIEKAYQQSKSSSEDELEITKDDIANELINQNLLLQEANKKGILVDDQEVDNTLSKLIELSKTSEEDLNAKLSLSGMKKS